MRPDFRIEQRTLEDVTVLEISGDMTEHEHEEDLLRTANGLIAAGRFKVVVNLKKVDYVNSTGVGALVKAFTQVSKQGGKLWLCDPSKRIADILNLTRLNTVFEFATPEDVVGVRAAGRLVVACPTCQPPTWIPLGPDEYQSCGSCRMQLRLFLPSILNEEEGEIACRSVRIPTYDNEYVRLVVDDEQVIWVDGRLDLFASEAVQDIWALVPRPRRIIFAVPHTGLTPAGLQPLIDICTASNDTDRSTIVITGVIESLDNVPRHPSVHRDWKEARRTLGAATQPPSSIRLRVRRA